MIGPSVTIDAEALATCMKRKKCRGVHLKEISTPKTSTLALGPAHPPVQGVKELFFGRGGKAAVA